MLAVLSVVLGAAISIAATPPAHAAAYRFWSYWQVTGGTWSFAQAGPGAVLPADGSVEGWRFGVTTTAGAADAAPRIEPSFETLCGDTAPAAGSKRVGLVIDFGDAAHAPDGEVPPAGIATCALVPEDANGYALLRSVAQVRTESGLVCGIGGFPAHECTAVVDDDPAASPAASASIDVSQFGMATNEPNENAESSPVGLVLSLVVVAFIVVLGAAARRRSP